jgi:hypothetical protein
MGLKCSYRRPNLLFQQNLRGSPLGIIVLIAQANALKNGSAWGKSVGTVPPKAVARLRAVRSGKGGRPTQAAIFEASQARNWGSVARAIS